MNSADLTFEALVDAFSADLYRYAYWLCREASLAEDLVQETFMRAWKALDKLENPESAKAWLFTILRRELSRYLGKQKAELISLDALVDSENLVAVDEAFSKVEVWALQQALKSVPQHYLEPLLLQVVAGYSCDEIADIMNIKSGAVMTRVCRARQQLRQTLLSGRSTIKRVEK